jgi:methenyltetrahydromethanopterin cyclohydrolase
MATNYKVLGQIAPDAMDAVNLYTVPASTSAIVSSVVVANRSSTPDIFRLGTNIFGEGTGSSKSWIAFNTPIASNDSTVITLGITLAASDFLRVRSTNGTTTFSAFGVEIS